VTNERSGLGICFDLCDLSLGEAACLMALKAKGGQKKEGKTLKLSRAVCQAIRYFLTSTGAVKRGAKAFQDIEKKG